MWRIAAVLPTLLLALFVSACGGDTPTTPSTTGGSASSTTGTLAISTTASAGWSTIDVMVDGARIGTLTQYLSNDTPASCAPNNARVAATVRAGASHTFFARSDKGTTWNGTTTVSAGGCVEQRLNCGPSGACGSTVPMPVPNPIPAPAPAPSPSVPLPQATCSTNSNGATTWMIRNDTGYTLQVDFTGAAAYTITLASGVSQTYNFAPGRYTENAHVVGVTGIVPWSGQQTILSGQACGQRYYLQ